MSSTVGYSGSLEFQWPGFYSKDYRPNRQNLKNINDFDEGLNLSLSF
jgi:hypothetical protein